MKIASHDTMSYLKPRQWWLRPFAFMARCQKHSFWRQYNDGARMFDFRFVFNNEDILPQLAHGMITYKIDWQVFRDSILKELDKLAEEEVIYVRVLNERDEYHDLFVQFCRYLEDKYRNIKFFGGRNKKTWKVLYDFGNNPEFIDKYATQNHDHCDHANKVYKCTGWWIDDIWPWLYAVTHNKKNKKKYADYKGFLMIDFI